MKIMQCINKILNPTKAYLLTSPWGAERIPTSRLLYEFKPTTRPPSIPDKVSALLEARKLSSSACVLYS